MSESNHYLDAIYKEVRKIADEVVPVHPHIELAEKTGYAGIGRYFDSINSKLFNFNIMLIAGFFTLIQLNSDINKWTLLIPIINLVLLIGVDFYMMGHSKKLANVKQRTIEDIQTLGDYAQKATLLSLITIISTVIVVIIFTYFIVK